MAADARLLPSAPGWAGLSWPLLLATGLCLGLLPAFTSQTLGDPDISMHVAAGRWMFEHRSVPQVDPFSFTRAGMPWVAHEWLAECVMAVVHQAAGWTGLVLLAVASLALTLASVLRFLLSRVPPIYALLFTALAVAPLATHLLARPHVLTWPILALWLGQLLNASEQQRPPPWWLAGLMVLWANLHGGFTLGLALVLPLGLEAVLGSPAGRRWQVARAWGAFLLLAVLASLATPAGWKGLWFTYHLLDQSHLKYIDEWQPATSTALLLPLELWLLVLLGLGLRGHLRLPPLRLLLLLGLLHQAMTAGRYISLFGLMTPLLIGRAFGAAYACQPSSQAPPSALDRFFDRLSGPARPRTMLAAVALVLLTAWGVGQSGRHMPDPSRTPVAAVDAALRAGASGRVWNSYNFGGHLILKGIPVFVDGRADLYGGQFLQRYFETMATPDPARARAMLDEFDIGWTLLHPGAPLLSHLDADPRWEKVYADPVAIVHLRRSKTR